MNMRRLTPHPSGIVLVAMLGLLSGCNGPRTFAHSAIDPSSSSSVLSGTRIKVALASNISSETARVGDSWRGTVTENVMTPNDGAIPPGSEVEGVVAAVTSAERGVRGMLELGVLRIRVNGYVEAIAASTEPVIAGSSRARNLGAIGGGSAESARVSDDRDTTDRGNTGEVTAAGIMTGPRRIVLSDGTVLTFTVTQTVAMR
jgi:hypothetical protein